MSGRSFTLYEHDPRGDRRPEPVMPSACETGGCGGAPEPLMPPPPSFGEVRVNGVEIEPEAIAQEIQHHPAEDAETAWREAARALAIRELLLQEARRLGIEAESEADEAGRIEFVGRRPHPGASRPGDRTGARDRGRMPPLLRRLH